MRINLHIERLVLDGLPVERRDGNAVKTAMEAELARLLAEGGLGGELASSGSVPSVSGGEVKILSKSQPQRIGVQIAGAVYGGLSR